MMCNYCTHEQSVQWGYRGEITYPCELVLFAVSDVSSTTTALYLPPKRYPQSWFLTLIRLVKVFWNQLMPETRFG